MYRHTKPRVLSKKVDVETHMFEILTRKIPNFLVGCKCLFYFFSTGYTTDNR